MADVIDFGAHNDALAELAVANLLKDAMKDIADGPLSGLHGMVIAWIGKGGLVSYRYSDNIAEDSVLAMIGPVQLDCSWKLLENDCEIFDDEPA